MTLIKDPAALVKVAATYGLSIKQETISFRDIGLDFLVAFAQSQDGDEWVLRIPRRSDVVEKSKHEAKILNFLKKHFAIAVPDWSVHEDDLIAYKLLPGTPGLTVDETTYQPTWHVDPKSPVFIRSFGEAIARLHSLDTNGAAKAGFEVLTSGATRKKRRDHMEMVRAKLGAPDHLCQRWDAWLSDDSYWPDCSVVIHGDLYAAHVVTDQEGRITGMLDWTEAVVGDPGTDFASQLATFGDDGFKVFLEAYQQAGGRLWPRVTEHCQEILAFAPVNYGIYALTTRNEEHLAAAKKQLELVP